MEQETPEGANQATSQPGWNMESAQSGKHVCLRIAPLLINTPACPGGQVTLRGRPLNAAGRHLD